MASLNVGSDLRTTPRHFGRSAFVASRARPSASTYNGDQREQTSSNAGVVRRDCQVRPLPLRLHAEVHPHSPGTWSPDANARRTSRVMVAGCSIEITVLRNAAGSCSPDGSRTRNPADWHRRNTGMVHQSAVPMATSNLRCWALTHRLLERTLTTLAPDLFSCSFSGTALSFGSKTRPFSGVRPR